MPRHIQMVNRFFSLAEAKSVCDRHPLGGDSGGYLDLSEYTHADPMAFKYLASQGERGMLELGLKELDVQTASILLTCSSFLDFKNLDYFSREVATVLSNSHGCLGIDGVHDVKVEVISELARHRGSLSLSFMDKLTMEMATELARQRWGELFVRVPEQPSMPVQLKLFYDYAGIAVTLQFPYDSKNFNSDSYGLCHKTVLVQVVNGENGESWCNITASDSADSRHERMEFIRERGCDASPD